tara:strand:- start:1487 stop:1930 length:444 start_codon:yes stop_codon:yes gene_type:complete
MKKSIFIICIIALTACKSVEYFGTKFTDQNVVQYDSVKDRAFEEGSIMTSIEGTILETCPKRGCWMTMATQSDTVFVRFRNYGFFVPTEGAEGKTAIVQGDLFVDTISVRMLQHYAKDAGKSKEEIAKITEPELGLSFTADGVIIKK